MFMKKVRIEIYLMRETKQKPEAHEIIFTKFKLRYSLVRDINLN